MNDKTVLVADWPVKIETVREWMGLTDSMPKDSFGLLPLAKEQRIAAETPLRIETMTDDCKNHDGPPESLFLTCSVCGKNTWIPAKPLGGVGELEVFIATED